MVASVVMVIILLSSRSKWPSWSCPTWSSRFPPVVHLVWCTQKPEGVSECGSAVHEPVPYFVHCEFKIGCRSDALTQGFVYPSPALVSPSVCGKWVSCVVPAPSKSSWGSKHWEDSLQEPPCDNPRPLSPSPLSVTTLTEGRRECGNMSSWIMIS